MDDRIKKYFSLSRSKRGKSNLLALSKFFLFLTLLIAVYTATFQVIMVFIEKSSYSWISGFYWVLITMTTLGTGDIYFNSDLGRLFSTLVLISGVFFLLTILPYVLISLFVFPWMEDIAKHRIPKEPSIPLKDHVIICGEDSIALSLAQKLRLTKQPFIFVEGDVNKAESLYDEGLPVIHGDLSDEKTYKKLNIESAKIVFANQSDVTNSQIALTTRGISETPIIAIAETGASKDILHFAGCKFVLPVKEILGKYLANRCMSGSAHSNIMGNLEKLKIVEFPVYGTPFMGKMLSDLKIRETTGVNVIGFWERGEFLPPKSGYKLTDKSVLVLMGERENLINLDTFMSIYIPSDDPIIIIGAGTVGLFVAKELDKKGTPYYLVDAIDYKGNLAKGTFIQGDAKERKVLEKAGIMKAPTVVVTTSDDGVNGYLTLYFRSLNKKLRIVSRANFDKNLNAIHKAGADFVVSYTMIGTSIVNNILQKGDLTLLAEGLHIFRHKTPKIHVGKTIAETNIGSLTGCNIIAISKNGKLINAPPHSFILESGDTLVMIGNMEQEERFKKQFIT